MILENNLSRHISNISYDALTFSEYYQGYLILKDHYQTAINSTKVHIIFIVCTVNAIMEVNSIQKYLDLVSLFIFERKFIIVTLQTIYNESVRVKDISDITHIL